MGASVEEGSTLTDALREGVVLGWVSGGRSLRSSEAHQLRVPFRVCGPVRFNSGTIPHMGRRRSWSPPHDHHLIAASLGTTARDSGAAPGTWSRNPKSHIILYQPQCGAPSCSKDAMHWTRCACGEIFARCNSHSPGGDAPGPSATTLRQEHEKTCDARRYP